MCVCVKRLLSVWFRPTTTYSVTAYGNVVFDLCPLLETHNQCVKWELLVTMSNKMPCDSVTYWVSPCGRKSHGLLNMVSSPWTFWTDTQYSDVIYSTHFNWFKYLVNGNKCVLDARKYSSVLLQHVLASFSPSLGRSSPFWSWYVKSTWFTLAAKLLLCNMNYFCGLLKFSKF